MSDGVGLGVSVENAREIKCFFLSQSHQKVSQRNYSVPLLVFLLVYLKTRWCFTAAVELTTDILAITKQASATQFEHLSDLISISF